jgi:hypothetical protein
MASNIGEIRSGVIGPDGLGGRVKDAAGKLSRVPALSCDVDVAILAAAEEYSKARPREIALLVTGTAGFDYPVATKLPGWSDGFSSISSIVYPWSATSATPPVLDTERYAIVRLSTGLVLRFFDVVPTVAEQFHATFSAPHTLSVSTCTVRPSDDEALKDLAAAHCCEILAGYYNQVTDSAIAADAVDRRSLSDMYRSQAKRWRESYDAKMQADKSDGAAFAVATIETRFGNQQRSDYFSHGRR